MQENCLNQGGGGCSELRSHHCTPVGDRVRLHVKNQTKQNRNSADLRMLILYPETLLKLFIRSTSLLAVFRVF